MFSYTDADQIEDYLSCLFRNVEWQDGDFICVRALPEKGSPAKGGPREFFYSPKEEDYVAAIKELAPKMELDYYGLYIVPAVLKGRSGKKSNVRLSPVVIVDIDSGDAAAKSKHLIAHLGRPTMDVNSGGKTEEGHLKRHLYWALDTPEDCIEQMECIRGTIADKAGGDRALRTVQQLIRIAGTCHSKGGVKKPCELVDCSGGNGYDIGLLEVLANDMPPGPGGRAPNAGAGMFNSQSGNGAPAMGQTLTGVVREGGDIVNRWSEFTRVAGHYLHCVREGEMKLPDAMERTFGWAVASMQPCWPQEDMERQFQGLLERDIENNGPFPEARKPLFGPDTGRGEADEEAALAVSEEDIGLAMWAPYRWMSQERPDRKFLVEGLVMEGKPHLLAADGGAGKTFLMLDLCRKVVAAQTRGGLTWCGQRVVSGGRAVLITTEDDGAELTIRLMDIDKDDGLYRGIVADDETKDDLIIPPIVDKIGCFTLCDPNGSPTAEWNEFIDLLKKEHARKPIALVCIDTLASTYHGDENSSVVAQQYTAQLSRVRLETGAATFVSHHIRKRGQKSEAVGSAESMRDAIRGSTALVGSFRVVIGLWKSSNDYKRLEAMGIERRQNTLYNLAVVKANNPEMLDYEKTLLRLPSGLMDDVSERDVMNKTAGVEMKKRQFREQLAWLKLAIEKATRDGCPYSSAGRTSPNGLQQRSAELPPAIRDLPWGDKETLRMRLVEDGSLVMCAAGGGSSRNLLDVKDGVMATDQAGMVLAKGAYEPPDWSDYQYEPQSGQVLFAPASSTGQMTFKSGL